MEFIDYDTFGVSDTISTSAGDGALPEPVAILNLNALSFEKPDEHNEINLSELLVDRGTTDGGKNVNLNAKMSNYAKLSMESLHISGTSDNLSVNTLPSYIPDGNKESLDISKLVFQQKNQSLEATNMILNKKLSKILNDYSFSNYQSTSYLRKSLNSLEENKVALSLDENKLTNPGYIGTLARKTLKSDVETELLKEHLTVLEEFRPIVRKIKKLSSSIENIQNLGTSMLKESKENATGTEEPMFDRIKSLRKDIDNLKLKKELLLSIRDQYTLTQVEDDKISNGSVDEELFEIINKVMRIKEKTVFMLGLENPNAGKSLMHEVNNILQRLNRKLFNHLLDILYIFESGTNNVNEKFLSPNEKGVQTFQRSLIYLSNDLEYFNEFLKRVTSLRSKTVLDQFLSQFDFNSKDANPIMLSAYDPLRYIGDILANVYSLIANEADFVRSLFNFQEMQMENTPVSIIQKKDEFLDGLDSKLLNEIIQSLSNTCRIRIGQIIKFEDNPITNFEIVKLLELYKMMFERKGIKSNSSLINNLSALGVVSQEKLIECYSNFVNEIEKTTYVATEDFLPPEWLSDYLVKITDLFEAYEQHGGRESDTNEIIITDTFLEKVIKEPIENTLLKQLKEGFPLAKKEEQARTSLYTVQINCFDLIKSRIQPFASVIFSKDGEKNDVLKWISDKSEEVINQMLELQKKILFDKTGLGMYNNLLNMIFPISSVKDDLDLDMYYSLSENSLMNLDSINTNVHEKLNDYVPIALTDMQGNLLFKLTSPVIADKICDSCFSTLSEFYITFRKTLMHIYPEEEIKIKEILNFSEEEFKTLVGIE
ncbi:hypothetical protein Kpol_1039p38 [Vanderwaltozyma polyspora DSM 70294]|uniref:Conserved oligomeric Golgi complex subunit 6 n=1 Tax=Vanderwaltozyma polyspora (strain ATCC 22028 / DSM 70294 / BCRC 21397 / CBS 2163 / NBRC 10782 / NRRL Y-8283 / UCD 57-17) TaxID=436907 RepID=COG6_VANPO|nr:uncharacterized protein Kpol_1039p38 [Vanderwaltozyma polyspora DSM 70294]A7THG4.1 RecName: Full=Conserved oligomeric Golgi complex subunit 6; Short=COG complex subunit 6; AltName: Full=Component of oligomeric Golgi complex 6 [Vanderwaltozyma polyspora DSM 70294]EDO18288.1 hypothetical protein Kpol_1039p38 [Vanderwaltozyma polyspora DSM 70294]